MKNNPQSSPEMKIKGFLPWWFLKFVVPKFPSIPLDRVGVCWGDYVYSRDTMAFSHPQKLAHEAIHAEQQNHNRALGLIWWWKYATDAQFRLQEELEAYRAEWRWILENMPDPHINFKFLDGMAKELASPHYGGLLSVHTAKAYIEHSRNVFWMSDEEFAEFNKQRKS